MALPTTVYMGMSSFGKTNLFNLADIIRGAAVDQKTVGESINGLLPEAGITKS